MAEPTANSSTGSTSQPVVIRENIASLSISLGEQIEVLAQELRTRWRQGRRDRIEDLGALFETVAAEPEQLLDLIYHEILIREEFGDQPQLSDYGARFPAHLERLERLFAVHGAIEGDDDWGADFEHELLDAQEPELASDGNPTPTLLAGESSPERAMWPRRLKEGRDVDPPPGYVLLEEIGRGGMAVVFRARQEILNRIVALKMLIGGSIASAETLGRLKQEARAVAQLQHPGIVQIHEVGEHKGLPYLSLEYVAGGTLQNWLRGRPLPPEMAARIIEQLARTTAFAHERGIVHRDLKPANVLLVEAPADSQGSSTVPLGRKTDYSDASDGGPMTKISDFGLARMNDGVSHLTATGQVIGTPSYMAPEQAAGSSDAASPALDIYSLGAILYELLTGRPPFRGTTLFETLEQVRTNDPVPPRQLQPRTPRDIETICLKCLEKNPARRYASALALANELRSFLNGESITARPAGTVERWGKWIQRNPAVTVLTLLVLVLVIGGQAAILSEARRANLNEKAALVDSQRAVQARQLADVERQRAEDAARLADQSRQQAEESRLAAVASREQAEADRKRAVESQRVAEVSLDRTLRALNSIASMGSSLRWQPGQEAVGRQLLESTLSLHEELLKDKQDDPAVRLQRLMALTSAGEIQRKLNNFERAEPLLKEAAEIIKLELTNSKQSPESLFQLLSRAREVWWNLGVLYKDSSRWELSLPAFEQCQIACDEILKLQPAQVQFAVWRVNTLTNTAVSLRMRNRSGDATEVLEQAIEDGRQIVAANPNYMWAKSELALALHDYSMLLRQLDRPTEAKRPFEESLVLRRKNLDQVGDATLPRVDMARTWIDEGQREIQAERYLSSMTYLRQAEEILTPLVERSPEVFEYHERLIGAFNLEILAAIRLRDRSQIEAVLARFAPQLLQTRRRFPQNFTFNYLAHDHLHHHANALLERGEEEAAAPYYEEAIVATRALLVAAQPTFRMPPGWYQHILGWRLGTCPIETIRKPEEALKLTAEALSLLPNQPRYVLMHGGILMDAGRYAEAAQHIDKSMTMHEAEMRQSAGAKFTVQKLEADRVYYRLLQALNHFYLGQRADAAASIDVVSKHQTVNYDSANTSDFWRYYARLSRLLKEPPSK